MNTLENRVVEKVRLASRPGAAWTRLITGIGDDAALFASRTGYQTILTCDWFLEGVHFLLAKHPPDAVGWKCLARAVSDIAAMGGKPQGFLLSLAIPKKLTGQWLTRFLGGLRRAASEFSCPLAGGDTTRREEVLISITAIGEVHARQAVRRSGARPGDAIFVSGRLGEAELGLKLLLAAKGRPQRNDPALKKHLYPEPRIALGQWLASNRLASAMMDLSDGLSSDLPRLCSASKVGVRIEAARIPAVRVPSESKLAALDPLRLALDGGDEYELLFTVSPRQVLRIPRVFNGIPLNRIGHITAGRKLTLVRPDGREEILVARGWDPFRPTH